MNQRITLNQLAEKMAKATGTGVPTTSAFIQALTDTIAEALSSQKKITVKGLGTFSASGIADNPIIWQPDETLSENVNQPFAAFEPVELEDGVTEEMLDGTPDPEEKEPGKPAQEPEEHIEEPEPEEESTTTVDNCEAESDETPAMEDDIDAPTAGDDTETAENPDEPKESLIEPQEATIDNETPVHSSRKPRLNPWLMLIIGLLTGFIIGYFSSPYINEAVYGDICQESDRPTAVIATEALPAEEQPDTALSEPSETIATAPVVQEVPKPAIVTDTVTSRRYLTTMSRKYYGDYRFWVYIYLENSDIIDNPDRIKPGTVVVIPAAEKYGINPEDPASVAAANEKIRTILSEMDK